MKINFPLTPYENVIFDIGNVMLDWRPGDVVSKAFGVSKNIPFYLEQTFSSKEWAAFDRGMLDDAEICNIFSKKLNVSLDQAAYLLQTAKESLVPFENSLVFLNRLHEQRLNLYALTNMPESIFAFVHAKYSFWEKFKQITVSARVKMIKPDPNVFHYILQKNNLDPQKTIFLDDLAPNVQAAQAVGMAGIQFVNAEDCVQKLRALNVKNLK